MRELGLDADMDLAIEGGDLVLLDGALSLAQRVKIALSILTGEWFLDVREGVPWLSMVFVRNPNVSLVNSVLRSRILSVPEVARIASYDSTYDAGERTFSVRFRVVWSGGGEEEAELVLGGP